MKQRKARTERTILTDNKWVKITRDNEKRTFYFAKGYKGNITAHESQELSFKWVWNWNEAQDYAIRFADY